MLYVVATPIGNLGDMSPRAVDVLKRVDLIACEDTRVTMKLTQHFDIGTRLVSLHQHNEESKGARLAERMAAEGLSVALVTDAGMPAVSDPGALFVKACAERGIEVQPVPGASAAVSAVAISGFDNYSYTFRGFLPRQKGELKAALRDCAGKAETLVVYESPFRIKTLVEAMAETWGDVPLVVSCDLTKLHEKTLRGTAADILAALNDNPKAEKGEYVVTADLSGLTCEAPAADLSELTPAARLVDIMLKEGMDARQAMKALQRQGMNKNELYKAHLQLKNLFAGQEG